MKKLIFSTIFFLSVLIAVGSVQSQSNPFLADSTNVVLEECTGTWCVNCPSGHAYLEAVLAAYPRTVAICYHGPPNYGSVPDPWAATGYPVIQLLGMNAYPTAVIGRTSGIQNRSVWMSFVSSYSMNPPSAKIQINNPTVNATTRVISASIAVTALQNLTGTYNIFFVLTEDNLKYTQVTPSGNDPNYIHKRVSRALINGTTGQLLTSSPWNINQTITVPFSFTVPEGINMQNCCLNTVVYLVGTPYNTSAPIQNGLNSPVSSFTPTGIGNFETTPSKYNLEQNYPNPFNPTTNILFSVPKDGFTTLKIYDVLGNEVATSFNEFVKAGFYNVAFDGSKLSSGVYFYKLTSGSYSETKRMMLVK